MIFGRDDHSFNLVTSIVAFLLYKEWIVCTNNNVTRGKTKIVHFIMPELRFKSLVYSHIGWEDAAKMLIKLCGLYT